MSDEDLQLWVSHLVDDLVEEGPRLDYKEIQGLDKPGDRREVAKDISSFANEVGGTVLYGIPEKRTADRPPVPSKPYGISPIPNFESRVEDVLVDSIQPTLPEWRIRQVVVSQRPKQVVYVVWVPESWVGVHMVEGYADSRYYRRGQYRAVPMTEREVSERYERVLITRNWVDEFLCSPELNYVNALLPEAYRSHYVVCPAIASKNRIDFSSSNVRQWLQSHPYPPWGFEPSAYGVRTKLEIYTRKKEWAPYTEIYRNGVLSHWAPTMVAQPENAFAYVAELRQLEMFLGYAGDLHRLMDYTGPIRILIEITHMTPREMANLRLPLRHEPSTSRPRLLTHDKVLRVDIEDSAMTLVNEAGRLLKRIADGWFQSYGMWQADCFDESYRLTR